MNIAAKKPTDLIAAWKQEAAKYRIESDEAEQQIPIIEREIAALALPYKQGRPDAVALVAKLREEIDAKRDLIAINAPAIAELDRLAADELQQEQERSNAHLKRKMGAKLSSLPALAKNVERSATHLIEHLAALQDATGSLGIAWRSDWPQRPSILYTATVNRLVAHLLYTLLRDHQITLPDLKWSEANWSGLHHHYAATVAKGRASLLGEDDTATLEDIIGQARPPQEIPKQEAPQRISDEEIARANVDGSAEKLGWPHSGREYIKARDYGKDKGPQFAPDIDPFTGHELI
jgi:hypothetical protein